MSLIQCYMHVVYSTDADGNLIDADGNIVEKKKDAEKTVTYTTELNGEGDTVASHVSAGGGKYYVSKWNKDDESILDDDDRLAIMREVFMFKMIGAKRRNSKGQLVEKGGKFNELLALFGDLKDVALAAQNRNLGRAYTDENVQNIMGHLHNALAEYEAVLTQSSGARRVKASI